MKTALSIAGSDSCGGAGIQADIKTMTMNGVYAMKAVTALTAQNTTGVAAILESTPDFLKSQLDAVFEDIYPDTVKIGMVSSEELIDVIADRLNHYKARNIVVEPVMVATSGSALMNNDAVKTLTKELFPIAAVVTPNIPEAQILADMTIQNSEDMMETARRIGTSYGCAVLLKGGHSINDANDLLWENGKSCWINGNRIDNSNARDLDDQMADARRTFDWEKQWECSIDPETAKAIRDSRAPEHDDSCSMCGKFCAVRSMNKALAGEYIDIS